MQKWEYEFIEIEYGWLSDELHSHGEKGWELVSVIFNQERRQYTLFFKRPKQEE